MVDALEGFHWLRGFDYSVDWFNTVAPELHKRLGVLRSSPDQRGNTVDFLNAALGQAAELTTALNKLREIVKDSVKEVSR